MAAELEIQAVPTRWILHAHQLLQLVEKIFNLIFRLVQRACLLLITPLKWPILGASEHVVVERQIKGVIEQEVLARIDSLITIRSDLADSN